MTPANFSNPSAFLRSASVLEGRFLGTSDVPAWIADRTAKQQSIVTEVPLASMPNWALNEHTGALVHSSGKFFQIAGIEGSCNFPEIESFSQPIVNQPEIGILGMLAKNFDGTLYFLLQAKMEAGNVNLVQLSPTVQATRSNYRQVHGGSPTRYLDYFTDRSRGRVLSDQLQSEQGMFFLRKRNRNMIVLTEEDVPLHDDFCWLTLGQLKELLQSDNVVNMDSRTVISAMAMTAASTELTDWSGADVIDSYASALLDSAGRQSGVQSTQELISWLTEIRATLELDIRVVPLRNLARWSFEERAITRTDGRYFDVVGVGVTSQGREVRSWTQPIVKPKAPGVSAFVTARLNGVLHFLVQARMEPGVWNMVELAPTVQYLPGAVLHEDRSRPRYAELLGGFGGAVVRHSSIQSEEGGRFLHYQNRNEILEIPSLQDRTVPGNFKWATLGQLNTLITYGNHLNIEARSLLACLSVSAE